MDSWNKRYQSDKLYCNNTNTNGYYVGTGENPSSYHIDYNVMKEKEGYKNKLYYPHTSSYNSTNGYWLASPSARTSNIVLRLYFDGRVSSDGYTNNKLGVRPVVSLNSGITVNAEEVE